MTVGTNLKDYRFKKDIEASIQIFEEMNEAQIQDGPFGSTDAAHPKALLPISRFKKRILISSYEASAGGKLLEVPC